MIKKIIFVSVLPLTSQFYRGFFIDDLIISGFDVEYWDISTFQSQNPHIPGSINHRIVKRIYSFIEFKCSIKIYSNSKDTYFIPFFTICLRTLKYFRAFQKFNVILVGVFTGGHPYECKSNPLRNKIKNLVNVHKIKRFIIVRVFKFKLILNPIYYNVVFTAGNELYKQYITISKKTIRISSKDHDKYINNKINHSIIDYKYCVFLDEDFISHPDITSLGWTPLNSRLFYSNINQYFTFVEKKYNLKVVIATSPKSCYTENPFYGREIIRGKTCELVKYCEFTIAGASMSVSYPVLFYKPILFFLVNGFNNNYGGYFDLIKYFAKVLGAGYNNIDEEYTINDININSVSTKLYNSYKYNHLTSEKVEHIHTKEIFINHLLTQG